MLSASERERERIRDREWATRKEASSRDFEKNTIAHYTREGMQLGEAVAEVSLLQALLGLPTTPRTRTGPRQRLWA